MIPRKPAAGTRLLHASHQTMLKLRRAATVGLRLGRHLRFSVRVPNRLQDGPLTGITLDHPLKRLGYLLHVGTKIGIPVSGTSELQRWLYDNQ